MDKLLGKDKVAIIKRETTDLCILHNRKGGGAVGQQKAKEKEQKF